MGGKRLTWVVLCLLLLLSTRASAQDESRITRVTGRIKVLPNLISEEEVRVTYLGVSGSVLGDEFRIPGEISNLKVRDAQGSIDFSKRRAGNITIVRYFFRTSLRPEKQQEITITYRSANFTSKSGNLWGYSTIFLAASPVDEWSVTLELPGEAELYLPSGDALLGLKRVHHESGATICEWSATDSDRLALAIGYSPVEGTSKPMLLLYLALAGAMLVAAVAGFLVRTLVPQKRKRVPKAVEMAVKILEDRERRIVRELAAGQRLTQAELVKVTKLSKATVSRAVVELERRRVVNRERSGRVIRVKLQDWILET